MDDHAGLKHDATFSTSFQFLRVVMMEPRLLPESETTSSTHQGRIQHTLTRRSKIQPINQLQLLLCLMLHLESSSVKYWALPNVSVIH